ncbi:hypothetical protein P3W53_29165 [Pseudomonas denitrificans (nom. rej.)]|nr:hypothetical protein [Pseudomonas denitrificans (nom. rej.)]
MLDVLDASAFLAFIVVVNASSGGMKNNALVFIVFSFFSATAIADICREKNISHSDMIACMMGELSKNESELESLVEKGASEYGVPQDFYRSQRESLHERCMVYSNLGGQRSEILEMQCEIDGVKELLGFVEKYMQAEDVN